MQQPHTAPARVEMIDITKTYGSIRSLRGVNLQLAPGEVLGLVGDNGAGKSTLTKVLSVNRAVGDNGVTTVFNVTIGENTDMFRP